MKRCLAVVLFFLAFTECASAQKITRGDEVPLLDPDDHILMEKGDLKCGKYFITRTTHAPEDVFHILFAARIPKELQEKGEERAATAIIGSAQPHQIRVVLDPSKKTPTLEIQVINDKDPRPVFRMKEEEFKKSSCLPKPSEK